MQLHEQHEWREQQKSTYKAPSAAGIGYEMQKGVTRGERTVEIEGRHKAFGRVFTHRVS